MRHDTQITFIDRTAFIAGGYAKVRGYRSTRGWFVDENSLLEVKQPDNWPGVPALYGRVDNDHVVGLLTNWHADSIGLWVEFRLGRAAFTQQAMKDIDDGALFFCAGSEAERMMGDTDLTSGYNRRFSIASLMLTKCPSYRPNSYATAAEYLSNFACLGCLWPDGGWHDPTYEETPLHAALPDGWPATIDQIVMGE